MMEAREKLNLQNGKQEMAANSAARGGKENGSKHRVQPVALARLRLRGYVKPVAATRGNPLDVLQGHCTALSRRAYAKVLRRTVKNRESRVAQIVDRRCVMIVRFSRSMIMPLVAAEASPQRPGRAPVEKRQRQYHSRKTSHDKPICSVAILLFQESRQSMTAPCLVSRRHGINFSVSQSW
jgi:hypothetical protein